MRNDNNAEVEILDEEIDLGTHTTAQTSEDVFDRWKREEFDEDNHSYEGVYLGDGIYG